MKDNGQLNIFKKKILIFHWLVSFGARFELKLAKNGQKVKNLKKNFKKIFRTFFGGQPTTTENALSSKNSQPPLTSQKQLPKRQKGSYTQIKKSKKKSEKREKKIQHGRWNRAKNLRENRLKTTTNRFSLFSRRFLARFQRPC